MAGELHVLGAGRPEEVHGRMSILPQDAMFQPNIPIVDQLSFFLRLTGWSRGAAEREVMRVLELVELQDLPHRQATTLSHGMYKRLSLAQAFLGEPDLIILDEPTSGLDWRTAQKIRDTIRRLHERATILVSSHNMDEMQELCDHVAVLNQGTLVAVGKVDEVTGKSRTYSVRLSRALERQELDRCAAVAGLAELVATEAEAGYRLRLEGDLDDEQADGVIRQWLEEILALGVTPREMREENRIEELYVSLTS